MKRTLFFLTGLLMIVLSTAAQSPDTENRQRSLVVFTFDDAAESHRSVVAPLLKEYGFGATFYICEFPGFENKEHYMTWEQIRQISDMGFEIGNHGQSHRNMSAMTRDEIVRDIAYIEDKCAELGIPHPVTYAYPGYKTSEEGWEVLRERGYRYARHGGDKPYVKGTVDSLMLPSYAIHNRNDRTLEFLKTVLEETNGETVILTFHGVPDLAHPHVDTTPEDFRAILDYLKQNHYRVVALKDLE